MPETLHLVTQRDQPMGSVRRCCEVCGRMCWPGKPGSATRWTDDPEAWAAAPDRCGLADVGAHKRVAVLAGPERPAILPGIGSVWEHYRGERYVVVATSRHCEDQRRWLVTVRPLSGGEDLTWALLATPEWSGFLDAFEDAARGHRFRWISGPRTWRDAIDAPKTEA